MVLNSKTEIPYQVDNPTNEERHTMLRYLLNESKRPEDFDNIINVMSPPPDITTICPKCRGKNTKVAIIGGGEAGLSAAFELMKIGCDITLFEASDRIGGRIYTYYFDKDMKYYGELGAMRISLSHETTWHYINLFKLSTSPFVTSNINGLFYIRNARAVNNPDDISVMENIYPRYNLTPEERTTPWRELSGRVIDRYLMPLTPDKRKELMQTLPVYSEEIQMIDRMTYRAAYESVGLSQDAISMLGFLSTFDQTFFRLSLTEILQEDYTADFSFTYRINGGTINLPLSLYKALCGEISGVYGNVAPHELGRVHFRMGFAVDGIYESSEDEGVILEYRDDKTFDISFEKFDYVICTIPFSSLRRVRIYPQFQVMKMQAIEELNYEQGQKTFLFLDNRFWEKGPPESRIVGGSSSTDLPLIGVFYPSEHAAPIPGVFNGWTLKPGTSPDEPGVLLASFNWAQDDVRLGNEYEELKIYDVKRYVEKVHCLPWGFLDDKLISSKSVLWSKMQYIWGGGCLTKPEDKINFSYVVAQPEMNDRVFFAGEHISQKHVWQQGALQTAMIAANEVAKRIKERTA